MSTSTDTKSLIILDDGAFYVELNCNYAKSDAPGFLHRRCEFGVTTPGGYECLGSFQKAVDGSWNADVAAPMDEETGCDCAILARNVSRMDAIAALWAGRTRAYSTHF